MVDNWRRFVMRYDWYTDIYIAFLIIACFMVSLARICQYWDWFMRRYVRRHVITALALVAGAVMLLVSGIGFALKQLNQWISLGDFFLNLGAELFGIIATVFVIERVLAWRETKRWQHARNWVYGDVLETVDKLLMALLPEEAEIKNETEEKKTVRLYEIRKTVVFGDDAWVSEYRLRLGHTGNPLVPNTLRFLVDSRLFVDSAFYDQTEQIIRWYAARCNVLKIWGLEYVASHESEMASLGLEAGFSLDSEYVESVIRVLSEVLDRVRLDFTGWAHLMDDELTAELIALEQQGTYVLFHVRRFYDLRKLSDVDNSASPPRMTPAEVESRDMKTEEMQKRHYAFPEAQGLAERLVREWKKEKAEWEKQKAAWEKRKAADEWFVDAFGNAVSLVIPSAVLVHDWLEAKITDYRV
jgi:hypothetical protein